MGLMGRTAASVRGFDPSAVPVVGRVLDRLTIWDEAVRRRWPFSALVGPDLEPGAVDGDGSRLLVRPAILGFIAVTAITLGSIPQGSPFVLKLPGAWFFGVPAVGETPSKQFLFFGLVATYGGLVLFMRVWYGLIRTLSQVKGVPVRKLVLVLALWIVPLLLAPPLFSRDIYSYAAQGEMMSHHISPYHYGPGVLGAAPSVTLVDHLWINTPVPYGPLFMETDGLLTSASMHHELVDLTLLRLLAVLGVGLMALSIPSLARSLGRDPSYAFTVAVLNPVTILHLVGGAHNDALMLGLLMCGLAVARRGRPVAGIVLCALAAAVKVPAALGVVYIGWDWMGTGLPVRARIRPVVTAGLIATAVMGALSIVTGLGWSWVLNLSTPGTVRSWVAPATGAGILFTDLSHLVGIGVPLHTTLSMTRALGVVVACGAGLWLLLQVGPDRGPARHGPDHARHRGPRARGPALVPVVGAGGARAGGHGQGPDPHRGIVDRGRLHRPPRRQAAGLGPLQRRPPHGGGGAARVPRHPDGAAVALRPRERPGPVAPARRPGLGPRSRGARRRARLRRGPDSQHPLHDRPRRSSARTCAPPRVRRPPG